MSSASAQDLYVSQDTIDFVLALPLVYLSCLRSLVNNILTTTSGGRIWARFWPSSNNFYIQWCLFFFDKGSSHLPSPDIQLGPNQTRAVHRNTMYWNANFR